MLERNVLQVRAALRLLPKSRCLLFTASMTMLLVQAKLVSMEVQLSSARAARVREEPSDDMEQVSGSCVLPAVGVS